MGGFNIVFLKDQKIIEVPDTSKKLKEKRFQSQLKERPTPKKDEIVGTQTVQLIFTTETKISI